MGTTTTKYSALIKPDLKEIIRDNNWVNQNSGNMNKIDELHNFEEVSFPGLAWTTSGAGADPTFGTGGSIVGKFAKLGNFLMCGWVIISAGTTGFNAGVGTYEINLPVAPNPLFVLANTLQAIGWADLADASDLTGNSTLLIPVLVNSNMVQFRTSRLSGTLWDPTNPFTLAQSDRLSCCFTYPI
jgi:hypothetical protein